MNMQEFLRAVAQGKTTFKSRSGSGRDLAAFQETARLAIEAHELGYIGSLKPHTESYSGQRFCDALLVNNITASGQQYLA